MMFCVPITQDYEEWDFGEWDFGDSDDDDVYEVNDDD